MQRRRADAIATALPNKFPSTARTPVNRSPEKLGVSAIAGGGVRRGSGHVLHILLHPSWPQNQEKAHPERDRNCDDRREPPAMQDDPTATHNRAAGEKNRPGLAPPGFGLPRIVGRRHAIAPVLGGAWRLARTR